MTSAVQTPVKEKIRLYLGTGCGKTTATFGLALRALSTGKNVSMIFFDKLEENSSEGKAFHLLSNVKQAGFGKLDVHYTGINRLGAGPNGSFRFYSSPNGILPEDKAEAQRGLQMIKQALERGDQIVIADEMLDVARVGLIDWAALRPIVESRKDPTLLVMTGRKAPDWLMNDATTITTTVQLKHHGRALEGIDC
jgi:cob(I)alamin adenosyltransferase